MYTLYNLNLCVSRLTKSALPLSQQHQDTLGATGAGRAWGLPKQGHCWAISFHFHTSMISDIWSSTMWLENVFHLPFRRNIDSTQITIDHELIMIYHWNSTGVGMIFVGNFCLGHFSPGPRAFFRWTPNEGSPFDMARVRRG